VVLQAAGRLQHKEMFLAMALGDGDGLFEGIADLVVEDEDGLVVVDYKTDRFSDAEALAGLVSRYTPQVAAYAVAAEAATGRPVVRAVLLFVGSDPPVEHVIDGQALVAAQAGARASMDDLVSSVTEG